MSRAKGHRIFSSNRAQLTLSLDLEQPAVIHQVNAPDLTIAAKLLGEIDSAMRRAKARQINRDRIADRMNLALPGLERKITRRQVDSWMADSKEFHRLPAEWLPAFCWAVEDDSPVAVLVQALGNEMVNGEQFAAKALGEAHVQMADLKRQIADLTRKLGG